MNYKFVMINWFNNEKRWEEWFGRLVVKDDTEYYFRADQI